MVVPTGPEVGVKVAEAVTVKALVKVWAPVHAGTRRRPTRRRLARTWPIRVIIRVPPIRVRNERGNPLGAGS
jgi:hypothetical protein